MANGFGYPMTNIPYAWRVGGVGFGQQARMGGTGPATTNTAVMGGYGPATTNTSVATNSTQAPAPAPTNSTQAPVQSWQTDPAYLSAVNGLNTGLGDQIAAYNTQGDLLRNSFGYLADNTIDPNNPFSRAQLLQRSFQNQQKGNKNAYAARGLLYSGALQNAQNNALYNYQASNSDLLNQYAQQQAAIELAKANAIYNNNLAIGQAGSEALGRIEANPPENPAPAPAPTLASYANDSAVVAYLRSLYAAKQNGGNFGSKATTTNTRVG